MLKNADGDPRHLRCGACGKRWEPARHGGGGHRKYHTDECARDKNCKCPPLHDRCEAKVRVGSRANDKVRVVVTKRAYARWSVVCRCDRIEFTTHRRTIHRSRNHSRTNPRSSRTRRRTAKRCHSSRTFRCRRRVVPPRLPVRFKNDRRCSNSWWNTSPYRPTDASHQTLHRIVSPNSSVWRNATCWAVRSPLLLSRSELGIDNCQATSRWNS